METSSTITPNLKNRAKPIQSNSGVTVRESCGITSFSMKLTTRTMTQNTAMMTSSQ